jgi:hypothetical protein
MMKTDAARKESMMRILGRLADELFTDIEIVVDQVSGREFEMVDTESFRACPIVEARDDDDPGRKKVYFLGGPCPGGSFVTLKDVHGCEIRVERRFSGWIIVEIWDHMADLDLDEPKVYTALLKTGETVEFTDCHDRRVSVTRLRRTVSRHILRQLGVVV